MLFWDIYLSCRLVYRGLRKMECQEKKNKAEVNSPIEVDYDHLLSAAGEFGIYQMFLLFCTLPFYVFGEFSYYSQIFMTETPNHWCWIPELENLTALDRKNLAIPLEAKTLSRHSQCYAYVANWSDVLITGHRPNESWPTEPCRSGWEFNTTEIPYSTISSELGWVCEKSSYQATAQAVYFLGAIVGGIIFGWVADRYGRLAAGVGSNVVACVAGVGSVFAKNFMEFTICRFFVGVSYDNCMMMVYLLVMEYVAPKYRTLMANLSSGLFYTLGMTTLPWVAIACNDWKILGLVTSVPMAGALLAPLIMPESPQWLLSKGRIDDAVDKVLAIARVNKKTIPKDLIENFKLSSHNERQEIASILDIFKRPLLRKVYVYMCINYMCCVIVFDGLVRSISILPFNIFVTFTVTSFTEIPSMLLVAFILDIMGRKWLSIIVMLVSCMTSILIVFTTGAVSFSCAVIARLAVNMAFYIATQWAAEILPTSVRGSGFAVVHICGYLATVLSPYIVYLENFVPNLPLIIIGSIAAIGAATCLPIPETAGRNMPQSFNEAEDLIKNQKLFEIPYFRKQKNCKETYSNKYVNSAFEIN